MPLADFRNVQDLQRLRVGAFLFSVAFSRMF